MDEFNKLEHLLIENNIEYEREDRVYKTDSRFFYHQLRSPKIVGNGYVWDVIFANGSYGEEEGLLELYGTDMEEPLGYVSAKECLKVIKKKLAKEKESEDHDMSD